MIALFGRLRSALFSVLPVALVLMTTACETGSGGAPPAAGGMQPRAAGTGAGPVFDPSGGPTELLGAGSAVAGGGEPAQPGAITSRAALLLPLSGRFGDLGQAMLEAAQLAVFEMADSQFELVVFDTGGDAQRASTAARRAVEQGVDMIIGPLLSTTTRAAAQWARTAAVPVLSFSSDRTVAGNGVYILGFTPGDQVRRVVQYARGRGIERFAVIAPDDAYGSVVARAARDAAAGAGGRVDSIQLTERGDPNFARAVQGAMAALGIAPASTSGVDPSTGSAPRSPAVPATVPAAASAQPAGAMEPALVIAEGGGRLRNVAAVLPAQGAQPGRPQLLGTGTWDETWIGNQRALVGGWFAAPPPLARNRFVQAYSQAYGTPPPRLAGLAYDAAALAATVARGRDGAPLSQDLLTAPAGFLGSEGIFRLRNTGVAERGLAVLEVTPWGVDVISEAPQSFAGI